MASEADRIRELEIQIERLRVWLWLLVRRVYRPRRAARGGEVMPCYACGGPADHSMFECADYGYIEKPRCTENQRIEPLHPTYEELEARVRTLEDLVSQALELGARGFLLNPECDWAIRARAALRKEGK